MAIALQFSRTTMSSMAHSESQHYRAYGNNRKQESLGGLQFPDKQLLLYKSKLRNSTPVKALRVLLFWKMS